MPLPVHSFTFFGGCNCRAIRYKATIPAFSDRLIHPTTDKKNENGEAVRFPFVCICHCNDCRRATASILPFYICSPTAQVSASCVPRSVSSDQPQAARLEYENHDVKEAWLPADEVFKPWPGGSNTFLSSYPSSEGRTRFFCGRCGTNLAYTVHPMPGGWPEMLDILLGTVDREDLETGWLEPERHLWWDCGVDWIRNFATTGAGGLEKHPSYKTNEFVQERRDPATDN